MGLKVHACLQQNSSAVNSKYLFLLQKTVCDQNMEEIWGIPPKVLLSFFETIQYEPTSMSLKHKVSPPNTWAIEDDISRGIIYVYLQVTGTGP